MKQKTVLNSIGQQIQRLCNAASLYSCGEFSAEDYRLLRFDCKKSIHRHGERMEDSRMIASKANSFLEKAIIFTIRPGDLFDHMPENKRYQLLKLLLFNKFSEQFAVLRIFFTNTERKFYYKRECKRQKSKPESQICDSDFFSSAKLALSL